MIPAISTNHPAAVLIEQHTKQIRSQEGKAVSQQENGVAQISAAIQAGNYKIDLQKTSEKMALNLLNS